MYEIDELANIVAMAGEREQLALTEDIRQNSQREPAVLWRGKIVDGRCRQLACTTLGISLKTRTLDDSLTRDEVAKVVKSLNTRRNLTMTQKVMSAVKEQERTGEPNAVVAKHWAIGLATLKNGKYIKQYRPDLIEPLFDGKTIKISDPEKFYDITTDKVNTIARIIKKSKENNNVIADNSEEVTFTVDGLIKTEAGKTWYYSYMNDIFNSNMVDPKIVVGMLLVELANLKFKEGISDE